MQLFNTVAFQTGQTESLAEVSIKPNTLTKKTLDYNQVKLK